MFSWGENRKNLRYFLTIPKFGTKNIQGKDRTTSFVSKICKYFLKDHHCVVNAPIISVLLRQFVTILKKFQ